MGALETFYTLEDLDLPNKPWHGLSCYRNSLHLMFLLNKIALHADILLKVT